MPDGKAEPNQVGRRPCASQILENCKRGQKKKILQSPGEKQKRFCSWGCYLRIILHTLLLRLRSTTVPLDTEQRKPHTKPIRTTHDHRPRNAGRVL